MTDTTNGWRGKPGVPLNPDRWRGAINDALSGWMHPILEDEVPKDALRRLIQYEITAALDPAVSQTAADLVATARWEGMEKAARALIEKYQSITIHPNTPEAWRLSILQDLREMAGETPNVITAIRAALEGEKDA